MSFHQTKLRVLDYIRAHTLAKGEPPTMREIAYGIGQASPGSVHRIITILEAEGKIRRTPGLHRSIELVPISAVIAVELPPDLYAEVEAVAREAGVSLQLVVIEAVRIGFSVLNLESTSTMGIAEKIELLREEVLARTPIEHERSSSSKSWRVRKKMVRARAARAAA